MSQNIFQISEDLADILNRIEDYCLENNTDEIPESFYEELSEHTDSLDAKLQGYAFYKKKMEADIEIIEAEVKRLQNRTKKITKNIDRIDSILINTVKRFGTKRANNDNYFYQSPLIDIQHRSNASVEVQNEDILQERFKTYELTLQDLDVDTLKHVTELLGDDKKTKLTVKVDKKAIKKELDDDKIVYGAQIVKKDTITIK